MIRKSNRLLKESKAKSKKPFVNEAQSGTIDSVAEFLEESIESCKDGWEGYHLHKLDDRLGIAVGWADGFDSSDKDYILDGTYGLMAGIVVASAHNMYFGYEDFPYPYYKDGDTIAIDTVIRKDYDAKKIARYLIKEYDELTDYLDSHNKVITAKGEIVDAEVKESKAKSKKPSKNEGLDDFYVYEFPYDSMTSEDKEAMKRYNLTPLGKAGKSRGEVNLAVLGTLDDLKAYCDDYLGAYEMAREYLAPESNYVADFYGKGKDSKVSEALDDNGPVNLGYFRLLHEFLYDLQDDSMSFVFEDKDDLLDDALRDAGFDDEGIEAIKSKLTSEDIRKLIVDYTMETMPKTYEECLKAIDEVCGDLEESKKKAISLLNKAFGRKDECLGCDEPKGELADDDLTGHINFLIEDEDEAVDGYDAAMKVFNSALLPTPDREHIMETLQHIKDEELEHIRELKSLLEIVPGTWVDDSTQTDVTDVSLDVGATVVDTESPNTAD